MANEPDPAGAPVPNHHRRDFLRAIAAIAAGAPLVGQSLWLRTSQLAARGLLIPTTLSQSKTLTQSYTLTLPPSFTETGSNSNPETGTYTATAPPGRSYTYTDTAIGRMPGGWPSPITVSWTEVYSYSPLPINYFTYSWEGSNYTFTNSRVQTTISVTVTATKSSTYTWTTDNLVPEERDPGPAATGGSVEDVLGTVDLIDADIGDPKSRHGGMVLRVLTGARR